MEALEDIFTRHSISKMRPDPVPRELVEKLLAAGAQAPNHYRVRPWRFFVITGDARVRLGEVMAKSLKQRQPDSLQQELIRERARPLRAPVLIAIAVDKPTEPKVTELENICAAAAAAENILLAANALGLGAMWRTGNAVHNPDVKAYLGLEPDRPLIAFIYVGYPEPGQAPLERPSFEDRSTWID